ncbi:unnamed protein product [Paramecium pentaurelia]|uniref:Kinesin motor domain-containing protein n=1 Tax=Paramecium pentaurelia TaxID=43138 RepID=A0A8S1RVT8_9CILI|nr:unnamed protein product [Paramecium pentaurelia]
MSNNSPFQVYLRVKPLLDNNQDSLIQELDEKRIVITKQGRNNKEFHFDRIFNNENNAQIFSEILQHNINYFLEGYNTTILAYGITGSGKTHTIFGNEKDEGLAFQCLNYLVEQTNAYPNALVEVSFIEIYNETIRDLLNTNQKSLVIMQDSQKGQYISGVQQMVCKNCEEVKEVLNLGNQNRSLAQTIYNVSSSRSHAVIQVNLSYKIDNQILTPKLFIVDLAGSEKVYLEQKSKNQQEGSNINKSLLALSHCLTMLSDKTKKNQHIPYRNSKLTRLLQDSLGGNTKTIMIACVQQNKQSYDEILNTLTYSQRATQIKRQVQKEITSIPQNPKSEDLSPTNESQQSGDSSSKSIYLTKIYNDIYSNVEEYYEINNSIMEIQSQIQANSQKIEETQETKQEDENYMKLLAAQKENQIIEKQLQNALKTNLQQKQILKSLLLQITEEQQSTINYWKQRFADLSKQILDMKSDQEKSQQELVSKDLLIAQQKTIIESNKLPKNQSQYTTSGDSDQSYPISFSSSTNNSQIKKKASITQQPAEDRPRFANISHIKQRLSPRDRSPASSIFGTSPVRSPLKHHSIYRNLNSISKDDSRELSKDLSNLSIHKKSRVVDPQITTINLYGTTYINVIDQKENN